MGSVPAEKHRDLPAERDARAEELASLLSGARSGCEQSLGAITQRYRRYLLLVANSEISADLQAKVAPSDLVQETLMQACDALGRFTGSTEIELLAWLRRILHYRAMHAARKYRQAAIRTVERELAIPTDVSWGVVDDSPTPCTLILAEEDRQALERALARLTTENRQLIMLRTLERQSFAVIGDALGCTAEAARKRWVRALSQLRAEWSRHG